MHEYHIAITVALSSNERRSIAVDRTFTQLLPQHPSSSIRGTQPIKAHTHAAAAAFGMDRKNGLTPCSRTESSGVVRPTPNGCCCCGGESIFKLTIVKLKVGSKTSVFTKFVAEAAAAQLHFDGLDPWGGMQVKRIILLLLTAAVV